MNLFTVVTEIKFESLPAKKSIFADKDDDMKQEYETTSRALINLNRFNDGEAAVAVDSDGAIGLGGHFDRRVKLTPKKWHFLTVVFDCKQQTVQSYIDGIAACKIDSKSQPELKIDSEDFSLSPDSFHLFASPNSASMDCEVDVKRAWIFNESKDEFVVPMMNEEFMSCDPWKVGHAISSAKVARPEGRYTDQIQMIKSMLGANAVRTKKANSVLSSTLFIDYLT